MSEIEVLSGIQQRDYYTNKIEAIKQDINDIESGIISSYGRKTECVKALVKCYDYLNEIPKQDIAKTVINVLISMGCKRGIKWTYQLIDEQYKRDYKHDLSGVGNDEEGEDKSNVWNQTLERKAFIDLPHAEDVSKWVMAPEDLQDNQEALAGQIKELKRREQEYSDVMRQRHVAKQNQKEADIEGTPRPYDPIKGFFFESCVGLSEDFREAADTFSDISEKIEYYPPPTEAEDKKLAEGIDAWRVLIQWINEHSRPYADLKFSQSYPDWFATEVLNRDFGKHAAAVKSKVATLSGGHRGMTREQVGDKIPDLADKALHMKGMFDIANKAFGLFQADMPKWRKERLDPAVGTRKENVGPKLSEAAFGSDKDK